MNLSTMLGNEIYTFANLKELFAKANEEKSGDVLAAIAAENVQQRIAAKAVLSELLVKDIRNNPLIEASTDEVSRLIEENINEAIYSEIQNWSIDWNSIQNIYLNANVDENGNPLPTGKPVISGLKIDRNSFGCFRIKDIALKVYDINEPYAEFYGNKVAGLKAVKMQSPLQETTNVFALDEKEFKAHSLVNIFLDPAFNDVCLDGSPYNYTKVDICVNGVDYVFDNYSSMFDFQSIDVPGQMNSSVAESIKQCLTDPSIKKMMDNALIYTIYIKSNEK